MAQVMLPRFWIFLDISFTCRKAWHHYYLFLMSDTASTYDADSTPLSVLVCGELDEFVLEFEAPLHGAAWCQAMIDKTDGPGAATTLVSNVTLSLCSHGSFHDRVVQPMLGWPFQFLALDPSAPRARRLAVATRLLRGEGMTDTSNKLVKHHKDELEDIVTRHGMPSKRGSFLTASLSMLRSMLHADTQDVESANKIVTRELGAAPGQNPALTAARLTIKKSVTAGDSRVSRARAHMLPLMDAVSDAAQAHFHTPAYLALMNDPNRYVLPGHTRVTIASAALPDRATVAPLALCDAARAAASRTDQSAVSAHADADDQDGLVTDTTEEDAQKMMKQC